MTILCSAYERRAFQLKGAELVTSKYHPSGKHLTSGVLLYQVMGGSGAVPREKNSEISKQILFQESRYSLDLSKAVCFNMLCANEYFPHGPVLRCK